MTKMMKVLNKNKKNNITWILSINLKKSDKESKLNLLLIIIKSNKLEDN